MSNYITAGSKYPLPIASDYARKGNSRKCQKDDITMKVFCRYSMVDTSTGALLAFGEKWKTTGKLNADYINDGTQGIFRKHTMYHRNIDIHDRRCTVLLFALHFRRRGTHFNSLTRLGFARCINGRLVCVDPKTNAHSFSYVLRVLGLVGAGVHV